MYSYVGIIFYVCDESALTVAKCIILLQASFHALCTHVGFPCVHTVFPRNLAKARFYFKAPFDAATIRGRLDFEGGVYRDRYARTYTASIISLVVCT